MTPQATSVTGIVQFLSIPAILALLTGIGTFLKSIWDRYSDRRSIAGINRLSEYLDIDRKRDNPLLCKDTVDLIVNELNLRMREISGSPASSSIERVERWRRRNVFFRVVTVPSELRQKQPKENSKLNISTASLTGMISASVAFLYQASSRQLEISIGTGRMIIRNPAPLELLRKSGLTYEQIKSLKPEQFKDLLDPSGRVETLRALANFTPEQIRNLTPEQFNALAGVPDSSSTTIGLTIAFGVILFAIFIGLVFIVAKSLSRFDRLAEAYCRDQLEKSKIIT